MAYPSKASITTLKRFPRHVSLFDYVLPGWSNKLYKTLHYFFYLKCSETIGYVKFHVELKKGCDSFTL